MTNIQSSGAYGLVVYDCRLPSYRLAAERSSILRARNHPTSIMRWISFLRLTGWRSDEF